MTNREKNIAIAEWCGWRYGSVGPSRWFPDGGSGWIGPRGLSTFPDYCNDLNAMHEVESKLIEYSVIETFLRHLKNRVAPHNDWEEFLAVWCLTHATASQRAEALLKTIGKWKE